MPEDTGAERTLPASGMKRQRAREQGNIPRSQDLSAAIALFVALIAMLILGGQMAERMVATGIYYLGQAYELRLEQVPVQSLAVRAMLDTGLLSLPFMVLMLLTGLFLNLAQVGFLFTMQPLQPKLERLNPITGLGRFFSLRSFAELIKSILKLTLVVIIVWLALRTRWKELAGLMALEPWPALLAVADLVVAVWWRIALAMLVLGLLDYAYQRWQYERDLRMTPQEARQEAKELEGDPLIKRKIRQMQRQMAMRRMMAEVPRAEVVITNPTHYAVALRYDMGTMAAPVVVAKGARLQAERIRQIALEHNVPIVQRPELARLLYRTVEINQSIPESVFRTVAEVLSFVYQIDRRAEKQRERESMLSPRMAV
ncbi:MAG: flagellar biosynthesis protein FlhB [Candidatus Hydrogenedentes bacterium]|nr:flagellar biosynthesis protein FlhB [Candidatus Hydrogenedentota bacterium]